MTAKSPVLIAAISARALAASAKRAGYRPLVVDCFGDTDLAAEPNDTLTLPAKVGTGFRAKTLLAALEQLVTDCTPEPIGLVLGTGFEDRPALIAKLAHKFNLLGTDADTIQALKNPRVFYGLLEKLGVAYPDYQFDPPEQPDQWLQKRIGASGGLHIKPCTPESTRQPNRYFQRRVAGEAISVLGVASKHGTAFALSRQWTAPSARAPYRYGGGVSQISLPSDIERELIECALAIINATDVVGLLSVDFMIGDGKVTCLEINPRPGATLDIHDDDSGSLFQAHINACQGLNPVKQLERTWTSDQANAHANLYADRGSITIAETAWPNWVSDCPSAGITIAAGQPIASVHAQANTADEAEKICRDHLADLEKMLYDSNDRKELTS